MMFTRNLAHKSLLSAATSCPEITRMVVQIVMQQTSACALLRSLAAGCPHSSAALRKLAFGSSS